MNDSTITTGNKKDLLYFKCKKSQIEIYIHYITSLYFIFKQKKVFKIKSIKMYSLFDILKCWMLKNNRKNYN